jgi:hypothetical protein
VDGDVRPALAGRGDGFVRLQRSKIGVLRFDTHMGDEPVARTTDGPNMTLTEKSPPTGASASLDAGRPRRTGGPRRKLSVLVPAFLLVVSVSAGAGWLTLRDDGSATAKRAPATTASIDALASLAASVGHPVYWAGPKDGYRYELTHTTDGRIYIRYLPAGVAVGTSAPNYLTVGTYPVKDALATVRAIGSKPGGSLLKLAGGAVAALDPDHPLSTYVAYPGSGYEIEVYDPSPGQSRQVVTSGAIVAAGTTRLSVTPIKPTAAAIADLRALAASSGYPVYWAGPETGATYELSRLSDGRVYVRYLSDGVKVGAQTPLPTVGTYPVQNAFAAVQAIAQRPGATQVKLASGGIAVTDPAHPTSVYIAYPHGKVEVEVFEPSATRVGRLVKSGLIVPVS